MALFGIPEMREFAANHDDDRVRSMMRKIEAARSNAARHCEYNVKLEARLARWEEWGKRVEEAWVKGAPIYSATLDEESMGLLDDMPEVE